MSVPLAGAPVRVDPRGPRFAAVLTTLVLLVVLATGSGVLLVAQAAVFAVAAGFGLRFSPYGWLFRRFVRPRLGPPVEMEDERPPRFAQAVGFTFAAVGALGYLTGATWLGIAATAFALAAAFLNAAFGYCLGCEVYLLAVRGRARLGQG
ncbi:DUF4395 domain-containing protein [Streptacidiphilus jiangxiensis]|uniref:DUF4395 domain-containing protein n=1 Tax=Streptacidiphilus jiangxiensis TaxID=235985 RepID=A0A1H7I8K8_STRJI|nr:DUF4395 domain-containing protein [Streptacidiphilus jiangxiensis]SEK58694.1 protein of unknown function [Streptacidiphilus jiangxiensis]